MDFTIPPIERRDNLLVVSCAGRIVSSKNDTVLDEAVAELGKNASGIVAVLIVFAKDCYIDSRNIGKIFRMIQNLKETGGKMKLVLHEARIRELLIRMRIREFAEIFETEDEAVASLI